MSGQAEERSPSEGREDASIASGPRLSDRVSQLLVERYTARLSALVWVILSRRIRSKEGTADVVQNILKSYLESGAKLAEDDSVWRALVCFARRKCSNEIKKWYCGKRDVRREMPSGMPASDEGALLLESLLIAPEPDPGEALAIADELDRLDARDQVIVRMKLEGYTHGEIATELSCDEKTVQRRLAAIRDRWNDPFAE